MLGGGEGWSSRAGQNSGCMGHQPLNSSDPAPNMRSVAIVLVFVVLGFNLATLMTSCFTTLATIATLAKTPSPVAISLAIFVACGVLLCVLGLAG